MDRGQARLLTGFGLLLFLAAADVPGLPIAEARWVTPEARLESLTRQPAECLVWPSDPAQRRSAAIGRAAFRAPLLLGGQAARAGLSCASCHRNGRGNPHFSFPGLSGAPGTADVTSSLMSRKRGDGTVNPKPIPDLAAGLRRISREPAGGALETFIHGLIVEEFDGPEPPRAVLKGLGDYVRAMDPRACRGRMRPVRLEAALSDVDGALASAVLAARQSDGGSTRLLVGAARSALGRIDQRYQLVGLEAQRALLNSADSELEAIRRMPPADAAPAIASWQQRWRPRLRRLRRQEARSLYAPNILRSRLGS